MENCVELIKIFSVNIQGFVPTNMNRIGVMAMKNNKYKSASIGLGSVGPPFFMSTYKYIFTIQERIINTDHLCFRKPITERIYIRLVI
jgi:hypothetical protein